LAVLGPRITGQVLSRLRRVGCPTSAAALLLALATDARAGRIAGGPVHSVSPDASQVRLLSGTYRVPAAAAPLLRAAVIEHHDLELPGITLLRCRDGSVMLTQAMANLIARTAILADLPLPFAATSVGRRDSGPEASFAAALVNRGQVRIDSVGPSPVQRPHLPSRRPTRRTSQLHRDTASY
jgi:hypothetical protein